MYEQFPPGGLLGRASTLRSVDITMRNLTQEEFLRGKERPAVPSSTLMRQQPALPRAARALPGTEAGEGAETLDLVRIAADGSPH